MRLALAGDFLQSCDASAGVWRRTAQIVDSSAILSFGLLSLVAYGLTWTHPNFSGFLGAVLVAYGQFRLMRRLYQSLVETRSELDAGLIVGVATLLSWAVLLPALAIFFFSYSGDLTAAGTLTVSP